MAARRKKSPVRKRAVGKAPALALPYKDDDPYKGIAAPHKGRDDTRQQELPLAAAKQYPKIETPLVIPAPPGTYVLHILALPKEAPTSIEILMHVCTHFERFPDRIVPRCMIAARDDIIEAAVLHPTGQVSGSPKVPITFENVDQYRHNLVKRYLGSGVVETVVDAAPSKAVTRNSEAFQRARAALGMNDDDDLVG